MCFDDSFGLFALTSFFVKKYADPLPSPLLKLSQNHSPISIHASQNHSISYQHQKQQQKTAHKKAGEGKL
jgi:hypothetical protein